MPIDRAGVKAILARLDFSRDGVRLADLELKSATLQVRVEALYRRDGRNRRGFKFGFRFSFRHFPLPPDRYMRASMFADLDVLEMPLAVIARPPSRGQCASLGLPVRASRARYRLRP